jgi:hypothetical protein
MYSVMVKEEFNDKSCTCKLCKRDLSDAKAAFRTVYELQRAHTTAHLQDVMRDMKAVCTHIAEVGWVDTDMTRLAQKALGELEIIDGGIF